jgi:hypothetical protein
MKKKYVQEIFVTALAAAALTSSALAAAPRPGREDYEVVGGISASISLSSFYNWNNFTFSKQGS